MQSTIETHPERPRIDEAILAGLSVRKVAASVSPPLSHTAVQRYKNTVLRPAMRRELAIAKVLGQGKSSIPSELAEVVTDGTVKALRASPFRSRLEKLWERTEKGLDRAESAVRTITDRDTGELVAVGADVTAIAPLLNQAHKNLEILGQVTGELTRDAQQANQTIYIVTPAVNINTAPAEPEPMVIDVTPSRG